MNEDYWLERLDAHMKRGNEIMRRSDETMRRSDETMRRSDETMRRFEHREDDLRHFIRDQITRSDRVTERLVSSFEARMDEMGKEIRASTRATYALIDRFNGKGSA